MFLDKNHQKFAKAISIHVYGECFLIFLNDFLYLKILAFLAKNVIFLTLKLQI